MKFNGTKKRWINEKKNEKRKIEKSTRRKITARYNIIRIIFDASLQTDVNLSQLSLNLPAIIYTYIYVPWRWRPHNRNINLQLVLDVWQTAGVPLACVIFISYYMHSQLTRVRGTTRNIVYYFVLFLFFVVVSLYIYNASMILFSKVLDLRWGQTNTHTGCARDVAFFRKRFIDCTVCEFCILRMHTVSIETGQSASHPGQPQSVIRFVCVTQQTWMIFNSYHTLTPKCNVRAPLRILFSPLLRFDINITN